MEYNSKSHLAIISAYMYDDYRMAIYLFYILINQFINLLLVVFEES